MYVAVLEGDLCDLVCTIEAIVWNAEVDFIPYFLILTNNLLILLNHLVILINHLLILIKHLLILINTTSIY